MADEVEGLDTFVPCCAICHKPGCTYTNHVNPVEIPCLPERAMGILAEAAQVIPQREKNYGSIAEHFQNVANMWKVILHTDVTPPQVILCMLILKILRENNQHKHDNLVDIAGYARLMETVYESR